MEWEWEGDRGRKGERGRKKIVEGHGSVVALEYQNYLQSQKGSSTLHNTYLNIICRRGIISYKTTAIVVLVVVSALVTATPKHTQ